jgi:sec-independent protein translocase protein TatA
MGWNQPSHIAILLLVAILLFAAPKLPQLARNLGESMRVFRSEVKQMKDENSKDEAAPTATTTTNIGDPVVDTTRVDANRVQNPADGTVTGRVVDGDVK